MIYVLKHYGYLANLLVRYIQDEAVVHVESNKSKPITIRPKENHSTSRFHRFFVLI